PRWKWCATVGTKSTVSPMRQQLPPITTRPSPHVVYDPSGHVVLPHASAFDPKRTWWRRVQSSTRLESALVGTHHVTWQETFVCKGRSAVVLAQVSVHGGGCGPEPVGGRASACRHLSVQDHHHRRRLRARWSY